VSRYVLRDFAGGGGNLLYATCAVWGIELARRDRHAAAGLLVALPLVLKPNLAPLVLCLAARARWKALAATLACACALFWLPVFAYGWSAYADLARGWFESVLAYARVEDPTRADLIPDGFPVSDNTMNQSLREAVLRLGIAAWIQRGLAVVLVIAGWLTARRARGVRSELLATLAFLPLAVLVSPIAWKAHHAALLPLFLVLVACALERDRPRWLVPLLVAYYLACDVLSEELVGKEWKNVLQSWSIVTWFGLAVFAAACALSRHEALTVAERG
jgi:arabinofuranan 3-O-arabinosyltransferase